jgi:hypothetical protein
VERDAERRVGRSTRGEASLFGPVLARELEHPHRLDDARMILPWLVASVVGTGVFPVATANAFDVRQVRCAPYRSSTTSGDRRSDSDTSRIHDKETS